MAVGMNSSMSCSRASDAGCVERNWGTLARESTHTLPDPYCHMRIIRRFRPQHEANAIGLGLL
jgi:hypothetical protein